MDRLADFTSHRTPALLTFSYMQTALLLLTAFTKLKHACVMLQYMSVYGWGLSLMLHFTCKSLQ